MKIAIWCRSFHKSGGVARHTAELSSSLAAMGHQVHIYSGTPRSGSALRDDRVRTHFIPGGDLRFIGNPHIRKPLEIVFFLLLGAVVLMASRRRFDLVVNNGVYSMLSQDVVIVHSCHHENLSRKKSKGQTLWRFSPHNWLFLFFERQNIKRSASYRRILFVSDFVREQCERHFTIPEAKAAVVRNGVDLDDFSAQVEPEKRSLVRAELGAGDEETLIAFAGYEYERKGLPYLVRALAALADTNAAVVVLGEDPLRRPSVEALAAELGIRERIYFAGNVSDIGKYFSACDLFAFPTELEAFPLVVLEAMACGLPVVVSSTSGMVEFLEHEKSGIILGDHTDPAEIAARLRILIENPQVAHELGMNGRKIVEAQTWDVVAERTYREFEKAIS